MVGTETEISISREGVSSNGKKLSKKGLEKRKTPESVSVTRS